MQTHDRFKTILMLLVCFLAYVAYFGIHSPSFLSGDNDENEERVQEIKLDLQTPKKPLVTTQKKKP